jgi:acetyl-CoA acyltransferase
MDAIGIAARAIKAGEVDLIIAGGVESMSRAPFVMGKAQTAYSRNAEIFDTTIGWRFINPLMKAQYGVDSMPETAENVAEEFKVARDAQDRFALASQKKAVNAQERGFLAEEIIGVPVARGKGESVLVDRDEHPRADASLEALAKLGTPFRKNGTVTAGNASGVNDGACALLLASEAAVKRHGLTPRARVIASAVAGVPPRVMGIGPAPATKKLLERTGTALSRIDIIELNEAFAAQGLAVTRQLGIADDDPRVNPQGGAIALGHPLGMSGARLVTTAVYQLQRNKQQLALCTMCIGVGQGIAMLIQRV